MLYVFGTVRGEIQSFEKMTVKEFERRYRLDIPYDEWVAADKYLHDVFETADIDVAREYIAEHGMPEDEILCKKIAQCLGK